MQRERTSSTVDRQQQAFFNRANLQHQPSHQGFELRLLAAYFFNFMTAGFTLRIPNQGWLARLKKLL